jgi:hypothetical protein
VRASRSGPLKIEHVFVVTDGPPQPDIYAVEAMPSGARQALINDRWTPEYAYVMLPEDYPGQGEDAAAIARAMIGTPYSFASYAALAAWHWGWRIKSCRTARSSRAGWKRGSIDASRMTSWPISGLSDGRSRPDPTPP